MASIPSSYPECEAPRRHESGPRKSGAARFIVAATAFCASVGLGSGAGLVAVPVGSARVRVEIKDPKGAPVADAVASLVPVDYKPTITPATEPAVIVQQNE